jgi:formate hydrogenlyase subunit 4
MRFSLLQLVVLVTAVCLMFGMARYVPFDIACAAGMMIAFAGCLSAISMGGGLCALWWRATLNSWLGLLLVAGVLFRFSASYYFAEVLWVTGLSALVIGTWVVVARVRASSARLRIQMTPPLCQSCGRGRGPR